MDRKERLFQIAFGPDDRPRRNVRTLAKRLGVSTRTIYRDLALLRELGIPPSLWQEPASASDKAGLPLLFEAEELLALALATRLLQHQIGGALNRRARGALAKLEAAMPRSVRWRVLGLSPILEQLSRGDRFSLDAPSLIKIQAAISQDRALHIRYRDLRREALTSREVEPMQLLYARGNWYLRGFCRLRQDIRLFRLERIERVRVKGNLTSGRVGHEPPRVERQRVRVKFPQSSVRWVRERQFHRPVEEECPIGENGVIFTYEVAHLAAIKTWLLSWGAAAEVLAPRFLREEIHREARQLLRLGA